MLTFLTRRTLELLCRIAYGDAIEDSCDGLSSNCPTPELLSKLESNGLIRRFSDTRGPYVLCKPLYSITLLEILEATGEHLDCNHQISEDFYIHYGVAAQKLGIINQMTRSYLSAIKIIDIRLDGNF